MTFDRIADFFYRRYRGKADIKVGFVSSNGSAHRGFAESPKHRSTGVLVREADALAL
jgi:hypothetical protein